jgi:serine protease
MSVERTRLARLIVAGQIGLAAFLLITNSAGFSDEKLIAQTRSRTAPAPTASSGTAAPRETSVATADLTGLTAERAAAFAEAARKHLDYLPGEVIVKFKGGTTTTGQARALGALRSAMSTGDLHWRGDVARLIDPSEPDAHILATRLGGQPEVEYAQPNYIRRVPKAASDRVRTGRVAATPAGVPNDPDYADLQWNMSLLNMPAVWDISPGGKPGVTVAVVDTGLTNAATTITRKMWVGAGFENVPLRFDVNPDISLSRFISPRDLAFEPGGPTFDFEGHGTHVAATITEDGNNLRNLTGIAYNTKIMPVKVCTGFWEVLIKVGAANIPGYVPTDSGGCATQDIADGIRYAADNGAKVINVSLGGLSASPVERDAIAYAVGKGAFVANSAGNEFESGNPIEYPAAYAPSIDGMMAVGAIGKSKTRAYYSSTGSHVEIAAPGGSRRDGGGEDEGFVWQMTLQPSDQSILVTPRPRFDRYVEVGYSGTSMATAHVSAIAALLVSQGVTSPRAIESVLRATALDLGTPGRDDSFGYGLIQPRPALYGLGVRR